MNIYVNLYHNQPYKDEDDDDVSDANGTNRLIVDVFWYWM